MLALNSNHIRLDWKEALKGRKKVVVGLSGGVDSAVSALRLKEAGIEVTGLFMKNWEDDDDDEHCSTRTDFLDATSVAEVLDIAIEVVNFSAEYKDRVFTEFLREYQAGRTPNPDVLCNAEIKFTAFLEHAIALGAECIATGHYAQIRDTEGSIELLRGADPAKDQTYFLHRLNQTQLAKTVFPIGDLAKSEVRELAKRAGLPNAEKKDSTGICFIGERPFREFLNRYVCAKPGPMKTPEGRCVGEHMGLAFYTLGQRKGLELGGDKAGDGRPWFVIDKDMATNTLVVAQGHDHPTLMSTSLSAIDASWISGHAPVNPPRLTAKTRYRQPDAVCTPFGLTEVGRGPANAFSLVFDEPQWAVTPGQSAVLYDGPICLGGGVIEKRGK